MERRKETKICQWLPLFTSQSFAFIFVCFCSFSLSLSRKRYLLKTWKFFQYLFLLHSETRTKLHAHYRRNRWWSSHSLRLSHFSCSNLSCLAFDLCLSSQSIVRSTWINSLHISSFEQWFLYWTRIRTQYKWFRRISIGHDSSSDQFNCYRRWTIVKNYNQISRWYTQISLSQSESYHLENQKVWGEEKNNNKSRAQLYFVFLDCILLMNYRIIRSFDWFLKVKN